MLCTRGENSGKSNKPCFLGRVDEDLVDSADRSFFRLPPRDAPFFTDARRAVICRTHVCARFCHATALRPNLPHALRRLRLFTCRTRRRWSLRRACSSVMCTGPFVCNTSSFSLSPTGPPAGPVPRSLASRTVFYGTSSSKVVTRAEARRGCACRIAGRAGVVVVVVHGGPSSRTTFTACETSTIGLAQLTTAAPSYGVKAAGLLEQQIQRLPRLGERNRASNAATKKAQSQLKGISGRTRLERASYTLGDDTDARVMPKRRGPERERLPVCVPFSL